MGDLLKIISVLIVATLLSGSQCTSIFQNNSIAEKQEVVAAMPVEGFAEDTVLILKYHEFAKEYLFQDAEKAMFYSKHVLRLSQKHQWSKGKILAYNLLSTYYLLDGSYDVLRELSNETMTLSKDLPLYTAHAKRFLAESYSEYRQWDSARINYRQAIEIFQKLGEDSAAATCIDALGNSYREKGLFDEAIPLYDQAYAIFDKMDSDWGRATVLQNRGYLHVVKKESEVAEGLLKQSLALFRKIQNRYGELNVLNDLANIYCLSDQNDAAIETASMALDFSTIFHSSQQTNWALLSLARAYKNKKMFKEALDHMEKVIFNRRMLHTEYVQRQYTMYQLSYENQIKDFEIQEKEIAEQKTISRFLLVFSSLIIAFAAFLWLNNKKLRRKNAEIREAMARGQAIERKRVAAELHDNLGGTLASLNWYLFGIDRKVLSPEEQKIYESVHQMVGAAYREVRSLSHNLMPEELEEHGLVMALHRLIDKMNENKKIEFKFNISGMSHRLNNKTEFELYSIILELTNNIIKHSGATKGSIDLTENHKNIHLSVSDNGSGLIEPSRQGVGLKNVKNRVESLRGKVQISGEPQRGLKIDIEIPKTIL
ncbi:tetratricopeptide repeat-containing sensor histidine kinase [Dyadobacter sp. CY326]|uniref:tetratricopeptide repeat-containing sensor histidine kinase n=1 Tax=Dyadobacter sp. CY326 TaxID=2907300 RepID=UPI001F1BFF49|nr:tetratricopeptide repeat-containing sensor histidine kinase [Dyadobacter sp. CY326]MCE7068483.1 tetratricopeptide repeat protein [Dyadobacter sp. CY326]